MRATPLTRCFIGVIMKKTFGKVLVVLMITSVLINLAGCKNDADSDIDESFYISTWEEFNVLGIYESGNETFEFYEDRTGEYYNGNSGNIRAALKNGTFIWTVNGTTITMKQDDNKETATWSNSGITCSNGRKLGFREPSAEDLQGKTATLIFPNISVVEKKVIPLPNRWYPTKIKFDSTKTGDEYEGSATVRARDYNGIRSHENESIYWKINGDHIILRSSRASWSNATAPIKHCRQTNKLIAWYSPNLSIDFLFYQIQ